MLSRARTWVTPVYLFACLVLGGSAQGIWQNMLLQLAGVAIIAWASVHRDDVLPASSGRQLLLLAIAFIIIVSLQLIPLPAAIWEHLGPRKNILEGFRALALRPPPEPVSLTPEAGMMALLAVIPSLAVLCAMLRLRAYRAQLLATTIIVGTLAGVALGTLQIASPNPIVSPWYLYQDTNWGRAVGFFANADHMATLLVITLPFIAAIVGAGKRLSMQRYLALAAVAAAVALIVLIGLALNGSLAGYALALPVIAASMLIILTRRGRLQLWVIAVAVLFVIGSVAALEKTPIGSGKIGAHATSAVQSRSEILSTTSRAVIEFMPFGSGLGSFQSVYQLYERPAQVTTVYVVHAHNDYAETALELGIAGIVLILLFLAWWFVAVWRVWRTAAPRPFARAASIGSAAILVHSLVDFPLRTAAISACFAACVGLLVDSRVAPATGAAGELRPTRHLVI